MKNTGFKVEKNVFKWGFIKTTDHRPTDHLPTDPPTTYHLPTDPSAA